MKDTLAKLVDDIENGIESPLKGYAILKEQLAFIQECLKQVEPIAMDEAEKYGAKTFEVDGLKFELRKGAARWDFKNCAIWNDKNKELKDIEKQLKGAYEAHEIGSTLVDEDGVVIELPTKNFNKDSLIIK